MIVTTGAAWWYSSATDTDEFAGESSIAVEDPRSSILFESANTPRRAEYVADQAEILRSGDVAGRATSLAIGADPAWPYSVVDVLGRTEIILSFDSAVIVARFLAETEEWATIGANSRTDAYATPVREQARVPFDKSIRVLDDEVARLEADLIGVQQEIRQAIDTPRRTELDDQLVRAIDRTVRLQNELALAGTEDEKAPIRTELADVTRQINLMLDLISLEASSPGVAGLNVRQSGLIGQIEDMSERRNRLAVDTQLLSSGVVLKTEAFVETPVDTATGRLLLVGGFLGALIGAGVAYLLALRRRVIIDRNAAELILAAPLIAAVPDFRQEGISSTLSVRAAPRSASAEAFRFAATALDLSRTAPSGTTLTEGKVVAVTSAGIEDSKTVVAANTALAAAREGKRGPADRRRLHQPGRGQAPRTRRVGGIRHHGGRRVGDPALGSRHPG